MGWRLRQAGESWCRDLFFLFFVFEGAIRYFTCCRFLFSLRFFLTVCPLTLLPVLIFSQVFLTPHLHQVPSTPTRRGLSAGGWALSLVLIRPGPWRLATGCRGSMVLVGASPSPGLSGLSINSS